jgi:NADPH-dependent 2,4-dienoyl-CoA reductase/sulfur reductase-like enzyme
MLANWYRQQDNCGGVTGVLRGAAGSVTIGRSPRHHAPLPPLVQQKIRFDANGQEVGAWYKACMRSARRRASGK